MACWIALNAIAFTGPELLDREGQYPTRCAITFNTKVIVAEVSNISLRRFRKGTSRSSKEEPVLWIVLDPIPTSATP